MAEDERGEVLKVPQGITLECSGCRQTIKSGEECWIEHRDSSHVYHLRCVPALGPRRTEEPEREPLWMAYE